MKLTLLAAAATARKRVPKGAIEGVELEREKGKGATPKKP